MFEGKINSVETEKDPLLIVETFLDSTIKLSKSNKRGNTSSDVEIQQHDNFVIYKNISKNVLVTNDNTTYSLDLGNAVFDIRKKETKLTNLNFFSYKGLQIPQTIFGASKNIDKAKLLIMHLCNGDCVKVYGTKEDGKIKVNRIQNW